MRPGEFRDIDIVEKADREKFLKALKEKADNGWFPIFETFRTPTLSCEDEVITWYVILVVK